MTSVILDLGGLFMALCDFLDKRCPIRLPSVLGYLHHPPAGERFADHENVAPATAFILIVIALGPSSRRRDGGTGLADQLARGLVHAENREVFVIRSFIDIQNLFHGSDKVSILLWRNDPPFLFPGLDFVFFQNPPDRLVGDAVDVVELHYAVGEQP